jgi:tRNA uridine 5-carbamoylmethylation protein Kti12
VIITIGVPGSGKSTWAETHLPKGCLWLERDRMREALWGSRRAYHDDPMPQTQKSRVIGEAMFRAGLFWPKDRPIALTDTGLHYRSVVNFLGLRPKAHRFVIFDVPDDLLRYRNRTRPVEHRIPPEVLEECIADFRDPKAWWKEANFRRYYEYYGSK